MKSAIKFLKMSWRYFYYRVMRKNVVLACEEVERACRQQGSLIRKDLQEKVLAMARNAYLNTPYYRAAFIIDGVTTSDSLQSMENFYHITPLQPTTLADRHRDMLARYVNAFDWDPAAEIYHLSTFELRDAAGQLVTIVNGMDLSFLKNRNDLVILRACGKNAGSMQLSLVSKEENPSYSAYKSFLYNQFYYSIDAASGEQDYQALCSYWLATKPSIVWSNSSLLLKFLEFKKSPNLKTDVVIISAGNLTGEEKKMIESKLATKVLEVYSLPFAGPVAYQCIFSNEFHVFPEYFLEIVAENSKPVAKGQRGQVLVTSLCDKVMPIIRYRTGHTALAVDDSKPCHCGFAGMRVSSIH